MPDVLPTDTQSSFLASNELKLKSVNRIIVINRYTGSVEKTWTKKHENEKRNIGDLYMKSYTTKKTDLIMITSIRLKKNSKTVGTAYRISKYVTSERHHTVKSIALSINIILSHYCDGRDYAVFPMWSNPRHYIIKLCMYSLKCRRFNMAKALAIIMSQILTP